MPTADGTLDPLCERESDEEFLCKVVSQGLSRDLQNSHHDVIERV